MKNIRYLFCLSFLLIFSATYAQQAGNEGNSRQKEESSGQIAITETPANQPPASANGLNGDSPVLSTQPAKLESTSIPVLREPSAADPDPALINAQYKTGDVHEQPTQKAAAYTGPSAASPPQGNIPKIQ